MCRSRRSSCGGLDLDCPPIAARMLDPDSRLDALDPGLSHGGPFDEADPLRREVVVEQSGVLSFERLEAVEVEVGDLAAGPRVHLTDRVGGARDRSPHAECMAGAADERGLGPGPPPRGGARAPPGPGP